jgi:hypothetical protein
MSPLDFDLHHVFQVGHLREASNKAHNAELKLFLEVQRVGAVHFLPINSTKFIIPLDYEFDIVKFDK